MMRFICRIPSKKGMDRHSNLSAFHTLFLVSTLFFGWEKAMSSPDIIVGQISKIDPPLSVRVAPFNERTVYFSDGRFARLDSGKPYSAGYGEVLDDTRQTGIPVYVELDSITRTITQLRIPIVVTVGDITRTASEQLLVELEISSARHTLSHDNPNFNNLLTALEQAKRQHIQVIVTETEDHEIIDVRPVKAR